jgi:uncharacterized protein (DUF305 family)
VLSGGRHGRKVDPAEGAVQTAKLALERAKHAQLRTLAKQIIAAQTRELRVMRKHAAGMH